MKKLSYTYMKPQNYYNRLFTFFLVVSTIMTFSLMGFTFTTVESFLVKFIVIIFLLFFLGAMIEFLYVGEYMHPLEVFDIETFANKFLGDLHSGSINPDFYFLKYTTQLHKRFDTLFKMKNELVLSSIRKKRGVYILSFIDIRRMFIFQFVHWFSRKAIRKVHIKKINNSYKIIHIS